MPLSQQTSRDKLFSLTVPQKIFLGLRAIDVIGHRSVTRLYEGEGARDIMKRLRSGRKRCARSAAEYSRRDLWCRRDQDSGLVVGCDCL